MKSIVFFLGAGASKAFGFRLTQELFPEIRRRLAGGLGKLFGNSKTALHDEKTLANNLEQLLPGYCQLEVELPLITDVLSLVDYSIISRTTPLIGAQPRDIVQFRSLVERAIYELIKDGSEKKAAVHYRKAFASWLRVNKGHSQPFGVVTTNYDLAIEDELFRQLTYREINEIDFGFDWRDPDSERGELHARPQAPSMRLYKLHGSINWLDCPACEQTYLNAEGDIAFLSFDDKRSLWNSCHCGHGILRMKMVAPSLVRDVRDPVLLEIWRSSVELLRLAKRWVIAGYSFPPEDIAIRSMFLRAYRGREEPPKIDIIQFGEDQRRDDRFRILFPMQGFSRMEWRSTLTDSKSNVSQLVKQLSRG